MARVMSEEHKEKMRLGRENAKKLRASLAVVPTPDVVSQVTANVLEALKAAGVIPKKSNGSAVDYETPSLAPREVLPPEPEIDEQIKRVIEVLKKISPSQYEYESVSALLISLRELGQKCQDYLSSIHQPPSQYRCAICGRSVNPERPAGNRVVTNPRTGMQENVWFDSSACVLRWDSGQRTPKAETMGPRIDLEP